MNSSELVPIPHLADKGVTRGDIDLAIRTAIENIDAGTPQDTLLAVHDWVKDICRMSREWNRLVGEAFVAYLIAHGTEEKPAQIQTGTIRHYVGINKTKKARSDDAVLDALLEATGGDTASISQCLASQPWKSSEIKAVLEQAGMAESFDDLFVVEEKPSHKEGKPNQKLVTVDEKFMPRKAR